jgi:hypothetical protein
VRQQNPLQLSVFGFHHNKDIHIIEFSYDYIEPPDIVRI